MAANQMAQDMDCSGLGEGIYDLLGDEYQQFITIRLSFLL